MPDLLHALFFTRVGAVAFLSLLLEKAHLVSLDPIQRKKAIEYLALFADSFFESGVRLFLVLEEAVDRHFPLFGVLRDCFGSLHEKLFVGLKNLDHQRPCPQTPLKTGKQWWTGGTLNQVVWNG